MKGEENRMRIIYKYTIDVKRGSDLTVEMPLDYNIVKTALQTRDGVESFSIWASGNGVCR